MARKLKANGEAEDESGVHAPDHNEIELRSIIRECRDGMISIKQERKGLNDDAKKIRERLTNAGLDTDTFDTNVKIYEMEQEARAQRMQNFQLYYNAMNEGETVDWVAAETRSENPSAGTEPDETAPATTDEELSELRENGRNAGKMGRNADTNPKGVDTDAGAAWHDGWLKGQKALADKQFGGDQPETA